MTRSAQVQTNFGFLESHSPLLFSLAQFAERYFADDPSTSIFKLRQFGENLVCQMAAITNGQALSLYRRWE